MSSPPHYCIGSTPADGIGARVISAAIAVVDVLAETPMDFTIEFDHVPWGLVGGRDDTKGATKAVCDEIRTPLHSDSSNPRV